MSNINFANPWLLLLLIPLLLIVIVPFVIAVRKENKNAHNVASFVFHIVIVVAAVLCVAGMNYDAMITKTHVYVLADVSASSGNNLDVLDGYIHGVEKSLPKNSQMSLIAFARDTQVLSRFGEDTPRVTTFDPEQVGVDGTNIAGAMRYVSGLLDEDVINRIVVITDGVQTVSGDEMATVVNTLQEENVYIDVIYLDNNIADDVREIQLTDVEYTASAFVGKEESAQLLINCNNPDQTRVYVAVSCNGNTTRYPYTLGKGQNRISVPLNTDEAGKFQYVISVSAENADDDTSAENNACMFNQNVSEIVNVLFLGGSIDACIAGQYIYGTENVDYITDAAKVPFTAEELCRYDEIVLCNFDVRTMRNAQQFVSSLDMAVSKFGKTLTTFGNTFVQETATEPNDVLTALGGMLPVTVGNDDQNSRLVTIVLDISTSMGWYSRRAIALQAVEKIIYTLNQTDKVMIISCCGDPTVIWPAQYLTNKEAVMEAVRAWDNRNGTKLQVGMQSAFDQIMKETSNRRELLIISDAIFHSDDPDACIKLAEDMSKANITVSALEVVRRTEDDSNSALKPIVQNRYANGKGYYKKISDNSDIDYAIDSIVDEMANIRIEGDTYPITLLRPQDAVAEGIVTPTSVSGFWYGANKSGVTSVLTTKYMLDRINSVEVPLYSYWSYGSGRVASFLSDISNTWAGNWLYSDNAASGGKFLKNIRNAMLPQERIDSPFLITAEVNGDKTSVTVSTSAFRNDATLKMTLIDPNGGRQTKTMFFDTENYVCEFDTDAVGIYTLHLVYDYTTFHYEVERDFAVSYYQEYDAFATCNVASLYRIVSENGEVSTDGSLKMDNSDSATTSYTFSFIVPLMVLCAAVYVLDVIVRMLRWKDIRSLFTHKQKRTQKHSG